MCGKPRELEHPRTCDVIELYNLVLKDFASGNVWSAPFLQAQDCISSGLVRIFQATRAILLASATITLLRCMRCSSFVIQRAADIEGYMVDDERIDGARSVALYGGPIHAQSATMYLTSWRRIHGGAGRNVPVSIQNRYVEIAGEVLACRRQRDRSCDLL
jgi:hypothetical protein